MKIISDSITPRYLAIVGIVLIMVTLIAGFPGSDAVSVNDPELSQNLEIRTWYDLDAVRDNLSGNHTLMNDLDYTTSGYDELAGPTANGGEGWQPIGYSRPRPPSCKAVSPIYHGLSGTFDGQGHEIRDLFINNPDKSFVGFLRYLSEGGIIKNVGMVNVTVTGKHYVGGLVGWNYYGTVSNSHATGSVTGKHYVGGLVGWNYYGTVSNSYATGSVTGDIYVGGLVGANWGTVSKCYSTGNVTGNLSVGGLVGGNSGTVSNSFWDIETSGQSTSAGGTGKNTTEMQDIATFSIAGWDIIAVALNETNPTYIWNIVNNVTYPFLSWQSVKIRDWYDLDAIRNYLDHSYVLMNNLNSTTPGYTELASPTANGGKGWQPIGTGDDPFTGNLDGQGYEIRDLFINRPNENYIGLFGVVDEGGVIKNIGVMTTTVTGDVAVGCLVGGSYGTVSNSYSAGNVTGNMNVGGLVGRHAGTVSDSYSAGNVTGNINVGGLVGANWGTVSKCYSTGSVSGNTSVGGLVGANWGTVSNSFWDTQTSGQNSSSGGTGKNTTEMKDITTFSGATWNIIAVANPSTRNTTYIWNIVNNVTYPFLSWQP